MKLSSVLFLSGFGLVKAEALFKPSKAFDVVHRSLQISDDCMADTEALFDENVDLQTGLAAVESDIDNNTNWVCNGSELTCDINFSSLQSAEDYSALCIANGGQLLEETFNLSCSAGREPFTLNFNDFPVCVAQSCNSGNIQAEIESGFAEAEAQVESDLGATCTFRVNGAEVSGASAVSGMIGSLLGVVAVAGALIV